MIRTTEKQITIHQRCKMKYLALCSILLFAGCDVLPKDESIVLPTPIVFEQVEQEPKKPDAGIPISEPKPKQAEPVPAKVAPAKPVVKAKQHWTGPYTNTAELQKHLKEVHKTIVDNIGYDTMLDIHDEIHETEKAVAQNKPTAKSIITQYTIASCGICKADARDLFPAWQAKGWQFQIVDETKAPTHSSYPYYEIRGADGSFRTHTGSLRYWK